MHTVNNPPIMVNLNSFILVISACVNIYICKSNLFYQYKYICISRINNIIYKHVYEEYVHIFRVVSNRSTLYLLGHFSDAFPVTFQTALSTTGVRLCWFSSDCDFFCQWCLAAQSHPVSQSFVNKENTYKYNIYCKYFVLQNQHVGTCFTKI